MVEIDQLDFSDLEKQFSIKEEDVFGGCVIIDNLPIVDESKKTKLVDFVTKIIKKWGKVKADGLHMPLADNGKTKGFLFVQLESVDDAKAVVKNLNGYALDKAHTLIANFFADFERFLAVPDEYVPPKKEEFKQKEHLRDWLTDAKARDEFVILAADEGIVSWNNKTEDPETVHKRHNWTEAYFQWATTGSYLATFHKQGVALWGGKSWERIVRFQHPNVKLLDFCPNDEYLVSWSPEKENEDPENLRVWDIKTGKLLRKFNAGNVQGLEWPFFKWSNDSKYVARVTGEALFVFEVPSMTLLDNKSFKTPNIKDFQWCPKENYISFWTPEINESPARVTIISIPSRQIVRTKNLFLVKDCKLHWQSNGDYLLVRVDRFTKSKKSLYSTLEMFSMREKDIPIEVYEGFKERNLRMISWEPSNNRFAAITTEGQKTFVSFFQMDGTSVKELKTIEKKSVNHVAWSPTGRFIVLAGLKGLGELEFWDVDELQLLCAAEHFQCSELQWDPTGRYVLTSVSFWHYQSDNGFILWDFKGAQLFKKNIEKFKQILWRPRPKSLLSKSQLKQIRRDLKTYSKKFDQEDSRASGALAENASSERARIREEWDEWRAACIARYNKENDKRAALLVNFPDIDNDEASDIIDETVEEVFEETEEIVD